MKHTHIFPVPLPAFSSDWINASIFFTQRLELLLLLVVVVVFRFFLQRVSSLFVSIAFFPIHHHFAILLLNGCRFLHFPAPPSPSPSSFECIILVFRYIGAIYRLATECHGLVFSGGCSYFSLTVKPKEMYWRQIVERQQCYHSLKISPRSWGF